MQTYLMIRNKGLAPVEGLTLFGVSTTRSAGDSRLIGEFGTGTKQAIALMLREGVKPTLYRGSLRLDFDSEPLKVDDGLGTNTYNRVTVQYGGSVEGKAKKSKEKLGFTLETGVHDWTDLPMAFRELVSNAIDRTIRETGSFDKVEVALVSEVAPKRDHTAWFIPADERVVRFYWELKKRFLHFAGTEELNSAILPKAGRNPTGNQTAVIYKKGVYVREWTESNVPSQYDYNFGDDLDLDESRTVDNYAVRQAVARKLAAASADVLAPILARFVKGEKVWEHSLEGYYLTAGVGSDEVFQARKKEWQSAWATAVGPNSVAVSNNPALKELVKAKGYDPVLVTSDGWMSAFRHYGVPNEQSVLTADEREGKSVGDPHPDMVLAVDRVWDVLLKHDLTKGKEKPAVKGFTDLMTNGQVRRGYYRDNTVHLANTLVPGQNVELLLTALEEIGHHVTGAKDGSRDLAEFFLRVAVLSAFPPAT